MALHNATKLNQNYQSIPETVVENCPETGEAKKKRGHLVRVYEMNWTPSGLPQRNMPETEVENCPETGEDKHTEFELDLIAY